MANNKSIDPNDDWSMMIGDCKTLVLLLTCCCSISASPNLQSEEKVPD